MNSFFKISFVVAFIFVIYSNASSIHLTKEEQNWLNQNNTVKVRVANWPPFQMNKGEKFEGISVDYIKKIFQKHNIKYTFISAEKIPWKMALESIKDKKFVDIILTAKITDERKKNMLFTDTYVSSPWVIFIREDSPFISDIKDLEGKTVSIQDGFILHELLKKDYPNIKLEVIKGSNSTQEAIKALSVGKVDAFIGNLTIGTYLIKTFHYSNVKITAPTPFGNHENAMAIRDDWKSLVSIINKELKLMSDKEKDEIKNKYLSIKYEYGISFNDLLKWIGAIVLVAVIILVIMSIINMKLKREIHKRKETQIKLKETNEKLNTLYKLSPLGLALTDINGKYIEFNDAFERICGYTKEELINLDYWELTPKKYEQDELKQIEMLKSTGAYGPYEKEYIQKDGTHIPINLNGILITHSDGKQYVWSIVEDITNRKRDERVILEQSKLASMGEMIGNIAHQWRQPLSVISTGATGMKMQSEYNMLTDELLRQTCDAINDNAQYLSRTIDDFKNFIKGDEKKQVFNVENSVNSVLLLLEGSIKSNNIQIILELEKDIQLNSYENLLTQCFINIFNNTKDALQDSHNSLKYLFIKSYQENDKVVIELKDNAGGIDKANLSKIFEPYFTTKHKSQGTGLGLHMTYNLIVEGMGGTIHADNISYKFQGETYCGAQLTIKLPIGIEHSHL